MASDPWFIPFLALMFIYALLAVVYTLPTIIADYRHDRHEIAIGILNLFGGWTIVGWVIALVWSLSDKVRQADARQRGSASQKRGPIYAKSEIKTAG